MDAELNKYRKLVGAAEYRKQYSVLYNEAKHKRTRHSKAEYINSPAKIKQIKEKYKNGVSKEIINQMIGITE